MVLPACAAANAEGKPAAPTIAAITPSTSSAWATSIKAWLPYNTSVLHWAARNNAVNCAAYSASATTAKRG